MNPANLNFPTKQIAESNANPEIFKKLDLLRNQGRNDLRSCAETLKKEGIKFSPDEIPAFGKYLTDTLGRFSGLIPIPDWLTETIAEFAKQKSPKSIGDPWAGAGLFLGPLLAATGAKVSFAFTKNSSEADLGKIIVEGADWRVGDPLSLLAALDGEIDLCASILPWGIKASNPITFNDALGKKIEIEDEFGHQILIASCMHLSAEGNGLFIVAPNFFSSPRSAFHRLDDLGLGIEAALALPSGTFSPYTNMGSYLVIVKRKTTPKVFVAQLSSDVKGNLQIFSNLNNRVEGVSIEFGRFIDPRMFRGFGALKVQERFERAEQQFGSPSVKLKELATHINLGRFGEDFHFAQQDNAVYIPLIGISDVVDSLESLKIKPQNYVQVVIDPKKSKTQFVAQFLNSEFGKDIRVQSTSGAVIPKLSKQTISDIPIFVPPLATQLAMMELEARISIEHNTILSLQSELMRFRNKLWADPRSIGEISKQLTIMAGRTSGQLAKHTEADFDSWIETIPFPLASILRAWQATSSQDFKTKYEHLLHFFEAAAEFLGLILLSAYSSNPQYFETGKSKFMESMKNQRLSFKRATFGTWKFIVEYFGKQTRTLLSESGKKPEFLETDREICADLFSDPTLVLPKIISRKEISDILSSTNKMRNDWSGHGGVVGQQEARLRNEQLLGEVQKLRDVMGSIWDEVELINSHGCVPKRGTFENEVASLMGSNSEFLKEPRSLMTWLDVEHLYLLRKDYGRPLKLLPLVKIGPSPQSAKNACYFYSRTDKDEFRFVSYHYIDQAELNISNDTEMSTTMKQLWGDE